MSNHSSAAMVAILLLAAALSGIRVGRAEDRAAATAKTTPVTAPVNHALAQDRILPEVRFEAIALIDVIDFLRDVSNANIFVDWGSLAAIGIKQDARVSMRLRNNPLSAVVSTMLQTIAPNAAPLDWTVDDDQGSGDVHLQPARLAAARAPGGGGAANEGAGSGAGQEAGRGPLRQRCPE